VQDKLPPKVQEQLNSLFAAPGPPTRPRSPFEKDGMLIVDAEYPSWKRRQDAERAAFEADDGMVPPEIRELRDTATRMFQSAAARRLEAASVSPPQLRAFLNHD
jgi:hypothetical protein